MPGTRDPRCADCQHREREQDHGPGATALAIGGASREAPAEHDAGRHDDEHGQEVTEAIRSLRLTEDDDRRSGGKRRPEHRLSQAAGDKGPNVPLRARMVPGVDYHARDGKLAPRDEQRGVRRAQVRLLPDDACIGDDKGADSK